MAQRVNRGLRGTPMAGLGFELEAAGWRFKVAPAFVAAIAGIESTFGAAKCGMNPFGWQPYCAFSSYREAIWAVTGGLRRNYIDRGLGDPWSIGHIYCPPCGSRWGDKAAWFMRARFGVGPGVIYP